MQEELFAKDPLAYSFLGLDGAWKTDSINEIVTAGALLQALGPSNRKKYSSKPLTRRHQSAKQNPLQTQASLPKGKFFSADYESLKNIARQARAQDKYERLKEQARAKVIKTHRRTLTQTDSSNKDQFTFFSNRTKKSSGLDGFNINSKTQFTLAPSSPAYSLHVDDVMRNKAIVAAAMSNSSFDFSRAMLPDTTNDKVDLGLMNKFAYELGSSGINIGPRKQTPPLLKKTLSQSRYFTARGGGAFQSERPHRVPDILPSERANSTRKISTAPYGTLQNVGSFRSMKTFRTNVGGSSTIAPWKTTFNLDHENESEPAMWSQRREGPILKGYKAPARTHQSSIGQNRRATTSQMEHNLSMIEQNQVQQRRNSEIRARRGSSTSVKVKQNLEHLKRAIYNNRNVEKEELENKKIFLGQTVALLQQAKRNGSYQESEDFERRNENPIQITPVPNIRSLNKTLDYPWNDPLRKEYAVFKIHNSPQEQSLENSDKDILLSQIRPMDHTILPSSSPSPTHYKNQDDATSIYPGESHFIMQPRNIHSRAARSSISPKHNRIESRTSSCHRRDSSDIHISMLPGTSHQILVNPTLLKYAKGQAGANQMTHFEYSSENGEHVFLEKGVDEKPRKTNWVMYRQQIEQNAKKRQSSSNVLTHSKKISNVTLDYDGALQTHNEQFIKPGANLSGRQLVPYYSPKQLNMPREMIIKRIKAQSGAVPPTSSAFTSMRQSKNTLTSGDPYHMVGTPLTPNAPKNFAIGSPDETLPTFQENFRGKVSNGKRIGPISVEIKRSESKKKEPKRINSGIPSSKITIKGAIPQHRRAKTLKNIRFAFHQKDKKKSESLRSPKSNEGSNSGRTAHSMSKRQALLLKMQRPVQNPEYEPIKTQSNVLQPDFIEKIEM